MDKNNPYSAVVIGNGWAAELTVACLALQKDKKVLWVADSADRMFLPVNYLKTEASIDFLERLFAAYELPIKTPEALQVPLREYKNRTFRIPSWLKRSKDRELKTLIDHEFWSIEKRFISDLGFSADLQWTSWEDLFKELKSRVLNNPMIKVDLQNKLVGIHCEQDGIKLEFFNGKTIGAKEVYYADKLSMTPMIAGMPRPLPFLKKKQYVGLVQVIFDHHEPLNIQQTLYGALPRESGEENVRQVFGYAMSQGKQSVWSVFIEPSEFEDKHLIAKKLRKLRSTVYKFFSDIEDPSLNKDFEKNIKSERVIFLENYLLSEPEAEFYLPQKLSENWPIYFVIDGQGIEPALMQVRSLFESVLAEFLPVLSPGMRFQTELDEQSTQEIKA